MKAMARNAMLCVCLILWLGASRLYAQEAPPLVQPPRQESPKQEPPKQEPPKQEPPKQEPARQESPKQEPAKQEPAKQQQAPKPISVEPLTYNPDAAFSIELYYWQTNTRPTLKEGLTSMSSPKNSLVFNKFLQVGGGTVSLPGGGENTLRISYFQGRGRAADTTLSHNLNLYSVQYEPGDFLVTNYIVRNVKISYDFLTFPNPPETAKFRLKTLWEVQGIWFRTIVDAPFKPFTFDSNGDPISNTSIGTAWFAAPTFGLGAEYAISKHFRWEARGSGFGFPHRWSIWDVQTKLAVKVSHFELFVGAKAFRFKTSPKRAQYGFATIDGVYGGLAWYPRR